MCGTHYLKTSSQHNNYLPKAVRSTNAKPEIVLSGHGRHLEKWIWRHISAVGASIWTKCGSLIQNNTQITTKWSTSIPEVEFQDGGRLFFNNGSSYISAVNWHMSTKFGLLLVFDLPNTVASTNRKPEVVLCCRSRHLEKSLWRHISAVGGPMMKFGNFMQNFMGITVTWSKSKPEEEF